MDELKALDIIRVLADGVDPETGEFFPADSPYQQPETIRALHSAVSALETVEKRKQRIKKLPERAGQPWRGQEDRRLIKEHQDGETTKTMARNHERTPGSITSRLVRLGLLHPEDR